MKKILVILFYITSLFGGNDFLEPKDAFKIAIDKKTNDIEFNIKLDKTIYLYDKYLKVSLIKQKEIDITKDLVLPKPVKYLDFTVHFGEMTIKVPLSLIKQKAGKGDYKLKLEYQGCSKQGLCYSPMSKIYNSKKSGDNLPQIKQSILKKSVDKKEQQPVNETDTITQTLKGGNIILILITFFGFGLLLALTPCIFPMIPILSSIIVHHTKKGKVMSPSRGLFLSIVYVLSMSVAYTIAGVLAGLFGANIQAMLQDPIVISIFVLVFIALAFSMFGYYELALPQSWQTALNKTSNMEEKKHSGIGGIAIMGFLSALIVGPCVAPPLAGALVYIGQTGDAVLGGLALFVMSLGMGMPLLAIGLGAGKYMPKPGGWMMVVSKVFGVVMLVVAIWMLDRIIPFIVTIWLVTLLCLGSAFYLLKNGNKFGKIIAAILVIFSIVFMAKGFENKDDKLHYTYVKTVLQLEKIVTNSKKPVMIDFWATWCISCIELDNLTFKDKKVKKELSKYLLIKVDVTKNSEDDIALMKKFNLFGPPALIFYKDGIEKKQKRIIGFKNADDFLKIVK